MSWGEAERSDGGSAVGGSGEKEMSIACIWVVRE